MWNQLNPLMEFSHNQKIHSNTKQTPFYLMMWYEPKDITLAFERTNTSTVEWRLKTLKKAQNKASTAHELARQKMADRSTRGFTSFKMEDKVWLDGRNLKIGYSSRKLQPKRKGPFKVTEVLGHVTYRLKLPNQWRIHPVFHASLLSPYHDTNAYGLNYPQPPPDLIEEEEYEVEVVVAHRKRDNGYLYLVFFFVFFCFFFLSQQLIYRRILVHVQWRSRYYASNERKEKGKFGRINSNPLCPGLRRSWLCVASFACPCTTECRESESESYPFFFFLFQQFV